MTSINLTRDEAQHRAKLITVDSYDVTLDLTRVAESDTFESVTTVRFTANEAGDTFIDLRAVGVNEVRLDGTDIRSNAITSSAHAPYEEAAGIALKNLSPGEHTLRITAQCRYSKTGQGLHRFVDPADNRTYLYSQCETADAKRIFACFDQPDMKARYRFSIHTINGWRVIGNAPQKTNHTADGTLVHTSEVTYPLSTYLIAVCAGPYTQVNDTWSGYLTHHPETPEDQPAEDEQITVPLGIFCRHSIAEHLDAERLFTETKQGFDYYHRHFGVAYPFGKYDQVFCPEYNMGAMENAGCVTIRDEYVFTSAATHYAYERRADTILHELAHMWFGDLVTMKWWDDLWLNESFATWAAAISQAEETQYDTAWVTFNNVEKAWAYQQDQLPTTHPVFSDANDIETVEQNFDGITYAKGASALKQLQAFVGREEFFAGVRQHFARHRWSNATFADLLHSLEDASGRDLSSWADQWLRTTGISRLTPRFTVQDGKYTSFSIAQDDGDRDHRIALGIYKLIDAHVARTHRIEMDVTGSLTEVPELVGEQAGDLVLVNDDDLTYCFMGLDADSQSFLVNHIAEIDDPMTRTLCWSAAWELTRAGEMPARDYIRLVASGIAKETELAVMESTLNKVRVALRDYADPQWVEETGHDLLTAALLESANSESPQVGLVFARALARVPLNDESAAWFRGVLDGHAGALTVDNDLRWLALTALIGSGNIAPQEADEAITQQASQDRSASGEQAALRAYAAVPTDESKQAVWDELTSGELSNLAARFKADGLTFGNAAKHLAQFNAAYFEQAPRIWSEFESELASQVLEAVYPSWDISSDNLTRADALLGKADTPAGLKRIIAEGRDRVARALRLREVDAS